uniref:Actin-related protein 6 n=2 Tax=Caligus rogercresseyi TaxID=217165 RepID=C1BQY7_CALRO|nr:Actin-related protein 6 [Caligus rogercresseyi]
MPGVMNSDTFVLDNGGYFLKAGFSNQGSPRLVPNCITKAKSEKRKPFIGDQIEECRDLSSLFYCLSYQKGYLLNWDTQRKVWAYLFSESCIKAQPRELNLILTEPLFNFSSIQEGLNDIFFEEFGFKRILRIPSPDLAAYKHRLESPEPSSSSCYATLIVDAGYSFTHVIPYINGIRVREAIIRIDVGGKLLTNHLKEIVSYRQLHVLEETYVMNACKEDACFVSLDFHRDMRESTRGRASHIARDYVLPDFHNLRRGVLKSQKDSSLPPSEASDEQVLRLNNERFTVPEILFSPSDVGVSQLGIGEAVMQSVLSCPEVCRPWLLQNVLLIGGCAKFQNMKERLEKELRELTPHLMDINVYTPEDPISYAWEGGAAFADDPCFLKACVSRKEFMERGHSICDERFY